MNPIAQLVAMILGQQAQQPLGNQATKQDMLPMVNPPTPFPLGNQATKTDRLPLPPMVQHR